MTKRLEIHYTPKHGSWLDIAEIELSALETQCLGRRIPDIQSLLQQLSAWNVHRNCITKTVDWYFITPDARTKLKHLYPIFS